MGKCDIGCGMCAVKTSLTSITTEQLKQILGGSKEYHGGIRSAVPVGFSHQSKKQHEWLDNYSKSMLFGWSVIEKEHESSLKQIGTLGGGNHFIEIQKGSDGYIWIMIHSGSRNIGYKVANHYNKLAKDLNGKWKSSVPAQYDLAFLPFNSDEGHNYFIEMEYCVIFAHENRKRMMSECKRCFTEVFNDIYFSEEIDVPHNYAAIEHHFGKNVIVHRKGATKAYKDEVGIVPGSQGTESYIVEGLGNPESFESCSHGAGRKMGRKQAQRELDLEGEKKRLDDLGVIHSIRNEKDLDEAAGAYKDIDAVMENQNDLVKILVKLKPLAVIKG